MRTAPLACFLKLASQERYFGLVHGSTAPSASDSVGPGITRSMSKSMVLPKPWQRGHAPKGELKLNRMGSGSANSRPQVLHWNFSLKRRRSTAAPALLEDHLARLAVTDLDGIHQALVQVGADRDAVHQHEYGLRKIDIEQRFGRGEFEQFARPETAG